MPIGSHQNGGGDVTLEDFAALIMGMSRLLTRLANISSFKSAQIGLADWAALSVLSLTDGISNKQLAKQLGVTGQRANQITTSLSSASLVVISQSKEDSRKNVITLTDVGKKRFEKVNGELLPLISVGLRNKQQLLKKAGRNIKVLSRVIGSASDGAPH